MGSRGQQPRAPVPSVCLLSSVSLDITAAPPLPIPAPNASFLWAQSRHELSHRVG